jgi:hypothetical protein
MCFRLKGLIAFKIEIWVGLVSLLQVGVMDVYMPNMLAGAVSV